MRVLPDDLLNLPGEAPAMELIALTGQAGRGSPGRLSRDRRAGREASFGRGYTGPPDVVDDRPADIDFLFQHIHLEGALRWNRDRCS